MLFAADTATMLDYLQRAGVLGLLAAALVGLNRRWWFPRWYVDELTEDRDEWRELAMQGTRIAERQLPLVETAVRRGAEQRRRGGGG